MSCPVMSYLTLTHSIVYCLILLDAFLSISTWLTKVTSWWQLYKHNLSLENDDWLTLCYCSFLINLIWSPPRCPSIIIIGCSVGNGSGHCPQPMSSNICLSLIDMRRYAVTHTASILPFITNTSHLLLLSCMWFDCFSDSRQSRTTELNALSNCVSKVSIVPYRTVQYLDLYHLGFYLCACPCMCLLVCLSVSVCLCVCVATESNFSSH